MLSAPWGSSKGQEPQGKWEPPGARCLPQRGREGCGFDPASFLPSDNVWGSFGAWPQAEVPGFPKGFPERKETGSCLRAGLENQREILGHINQPGLSRFPLPPTRGRRGVREGGGWGMRAPCLANPRKI